MKYCGRNMNYQYKPHFKYITNKMLVPSFPQHSIQANKGVEGCDWHSHLHGFPFPALVLLLKLYWGWSRINMREKWHLVFSNKGYVHTNTTTEDLLNVFQQKLPLLKEHFGRVRVFRILCRKIDKDMFTF